MKADRVLAAEATLTLVGVIASELLQKTQEQRALPRLRRVVAVLAFYAAMSLLAAFGNGPARFAAAAGGVVTLAALVLGSTGKTFVNLIDRLTGLLTTSPAAPAASSSDGGGPLGNIPGYTYRGGSYVPINPNSGRALGPGTRSASATVSPSSPLRV